MNPRANAKFDRIIVEELTRRLKREPTKDEIANADTDSDLVNEVLWQMINEVYDKDDEKELQISRLYSHAKIQKPTITK